MKPVHVSPHRRRVSSLDSLGRHLRRDPDLDPDPTAARPSHDYSEAVRRAGGRNENLWIKQEAGDNSGRVLLVQFSSRLMSDIAFESPEAKQYYDAVYSRVPGYERTEDFWEVPTWMAYTANTFRNSDVYVVRDTEEARRFLGGSGYGAVFFSVLDANKGLVRELARSFGGRVYVGGYVRRQEFDDLPNVEWMDTIKDAADDFGVEARDGSDYRHFEGVETIPRLCMSTGCAYDCAFCSVEKRVKATPKDQIDREVDAIMESLDSDLVYLNDKTFGQSPNYVYLKELYRRIKDRKSSFRGFIVQTTATQLLKIPDEFLRDAGVQIVEVGVESYNDDILKAVQKPHRTAHIDQAVAKLRNLGIKFVPNIIVGLPGETEETYSRTLAFLRANEDIISHVNVYNLAIYESARLKDELGLENLSAADVNENVVEKSFYKDPGLHKRFAREVYKFGQEAAQRQA